jgi:hypothetical protein
MEDFDIGTLLTVAVLLLAPAVVVFIILTVIRVRRSKFHRQRITKKGSGSKT